MMFPNANLANRFGPIAAATCFLLAVAPWMEAAEASVARLDQLVAQEELDDAVTLARELDDQPEPTKDLTLPLARLARALQLAHELPTAAEFYQRSVDASMRPSAEGLTAQKIAVVRLAAGSVLTQTQQLPEAIDALRPILSAEIEASRSQRQMAVKILLRIGSIALATGATTTASEAYSIALEYADEAQKPTAMLGDAWATAVERRKPLAAAKKLAAFVDHYPDHSDASRASRACAECLKQAGRDDDASTMLADLLARWPDSEAAAEVVQSHADLAVDLVPDAVGHWLMRKAKADDLKTLDLKITMLGILIATQRHELAAWTNLTRHLAAIDTTGQTTSDLLARLVRRGKESEAERLAAILTAPDKDLDASPASREAACRWAGRTLRWSLLALASESEKLDQVSPNRTIAVERLMAESLMQTGRVAESLAWWNYLVDTRQVKDFATLLRCAEAETAVGRDASAAEQRTAAARQAAGDNRFSIALVDMLSAELAIRRSRFDKARALLEHVVRSQDSEPNLRGRAQWLIGETHYLQRDFAEAIEAYRRVEGIDPGGTWVSAALLQAGKSFEQLGRTREAAVCYGNLLGRFADTPHADRARKRLAAISPSDAPSSVSPSKPTIRR